MHRRATLVSLAVLMFVAVSAMAGTTGKIAGVVSDASRFVQTMNDRFTNPSGIIAESPQAEILKVVEAEDEPEVEHSRSSSESTN